MPTRAHSPSLRRSLAWIAVAACTLILALPIVIPSFTWGSLSAKAEPVTERAQTLYVASGLTWADVTAELTPNLYCFSERSGVAAMALTSSSLLPTKRQGLASLTTGERTPALDSTAPATDGDARVPDAVGQGKNIRVIDLGDASLHGTPAEKNASLAAIDAAFAQQAGTCGATHVEGEGGRAAVASVGYLNPSPTSVVAVEQERSYARLATDLQMQVYIDSGWGPALLTSPSTRQPGVVLNVDIPATLEGNPAVESVGIGRAMTGTPVGAPSGEDSADGTGVSIVRGISLTTRATEDALPLVLGGVLAVVAAVAGAAAVLRRREIAVAALSAGVLAIPVGLTTRVLPLEQISDLGVPVWLQLLGYMVGVTAVAMGLLAYSTWILTLPGVNRSLAIVEKTGLITVTLISLDAALGSYAQFTSVLGNQPLYAGRFYGMTNHLTGILLGAWIMGCGAFLHASPQRGAGQRAGLRRAAFVGGTGIVVGGIAIAPNMGADAGSALIYLPAALVGALLVSGWRVRLWHILAALAAGAVLFAGVGYLDYVRPQNARTHLGNFVAQILGENSGEGGLAAFWAVFADRSVRMLEPLWVYPWFLVLPAVLAGLALLIIAVRPGSGFSRAFPLAWRLRAVGVGAAFVGAATNDTGLVLLATAFASGTLLSAAMMLSAGMWGAPADPQCRRRLQAPPPGDHSGRFSAAPPAPSSHRAIVQRDATGRAGLYRWPDARGSRALPSPTIPGGGHQW